MWARVVEVMLGLWLWISPFVFRRADDPGLVGFDLLTGGLVLSLALLSCWRPASRAHLGILLVALVLVGRGYAPGAEPVPADQNHLCVGLLLLMFAIVPTDALVPPRSWREVDGPGGPGDDHVR